MLTANPLAFKTRTFNVLSIDTADSLLDLEFLVNVIQIGYESINALISFLKEEYCLTALRVFREDLRDNVDDVD